MSTTPGNPGNPGNLLEFENPLNSRRFPGFPGLEILEISWNLNGPPGNFCVMIENFIIWLMALLHDDVALFVH